MPSDLEIARRATRRPIAEIASLMGLPTSALELYGDGVAKIRLEAIDEVCLVRLSTLTPALRG